jgi:hypothetical protein
MSQTYTADCFASAHVAQTDLQNMENNFAALHSCFSGGSSPANAEAGLLWFDTTKKVCKQRDSADAAWIGLMHGDTSQKVWIYRNAAMDGWAIDSSVTDKVLALKGGSTYTAGAASAGSWTFSSHTHQWHDSVSAADDRSYDSSGVSTPLVWGGSVTENHIYADNTSGNGLNADFWVKAEPATDGTWRPAASVGTLQYLDL